MTHIYIYNVKRAYNITQFKIILFFFFLMRYTRHNFSAKSYNSPQTKDICKCRIREKIGLLD